VPVYLHLANLIVDKEAVKKKYVGGIEQFRFDYITNGADNNQEDEELFAVARMNIDEFDLETFSAKGLDYDETILFSPDFILIPRYGTPPWRNDWLADNNIYAWHINTKQLLIDKALAMGKLTVDEIIESKMTFKTIKSEIT